MVGVRRASLLLRGTFRHAEIYSAVFLSRGLGVANAAGPIASGTSRGVVSMIGFAAVTIASPGPQTAPERVTTFPGRRQTGLRVRHGRSERIPGRTLRSAQARRAGLTFILLDQASLCPGRHHLLGRVRGVRVRLLYVLDTDGASLVYSTGRAFRNVPRGAVVVLYVGD